MYAVLFDLDSTLVDDGPNWRSSVAGTIDQVCARHTGLDRAQLQEAYYEVAGSVWSEIALREAAPWGNMDDPDIVRRVWAETLDRCGIQPGETIGQIAEDYLRLRRGPVSAYRDVVACLDVLKPHYLLGIVTNGAAAQQVPKLESAGLASYFAVVATTDCGYGKPHPEIFASALRDLHASPEVSAYVGDSLGWDVEGANRAGMASIWLNRKAADRKNGDPAPTAEIESLAQLPAVLRSF